MRISELISEQQTIGTVGSSSAPTGQPIASTGQAANAPDEQEKTDPNQEQLAKLLMPHGIKDPADLNTASAALQKAMTSPNALNPEQQELLGKLAAPMLKNQGFAFALKNLAAQKPGTPPPAAGTQPATTAPGKTV